MRVGQGIDVHAFTPTGRVVLAGVVAAEDRGVAATSDGDVIAHAVADALVGAAALGDLGEFFPSSDPQWKDADSMGLLATIVSRLDGLGMHAANVDVTVLAQTVRVSPLRNQMRANLAAVLRVPSEAVSVKATTTDHLGFLGRDEGIAAIAVVMLTTRT
ncbi:MAG TPA: 2-C-methyl-D-erythritol 2,4-cyclodiphosphate synthase [Acidimicrobiia bacterium]|jgi:2-C-methyl-D-erythritol 2,4-cyclodiphosphate synthase|nr:2-C-methyl-D-erythritol 2,4-cyclodiphosphate synthase [Acidimicrobiia bacterium]